MSTAFKKMMLLSQEEMERMKAKIIKEYDPSLNALAKLKDQIDSLLMESKLPPDQQLKLLQALESRFTSIKNSNAPALALAGISNQLPEPPPPPPPPVDIPAVPEKPPIRLYGIPKRYSHHAQDLRDLISSHPDKLSYNDRMELVVNGNPIPGSNFHDLFSDAFAIAKSRVEGPRPPGYAEFLQGLQELNAPQSLLVNPAYHSNNPQALDSFSTPKHIAIAPADYHYKHRNSSSPRVVLGKRKPRRKTILSLYDV